MKSNRNDQQSGVGGKQKKRGCIMKTKKRRCIMRTILRAVLVVSLVFTIMNPGLAFAKKERITIGGGSPGALFFLFAAHTASMINNKLPDEFMANATAVGGSAENAMLLGKQEEEFGVMSSDTAYHAYNGIEEFTGKRSPNLRAVTGGYVYLMNLIVPDESPLKSYKDIVGKRVATGPVGGSYQIHFSRIMSAGYGIDIDKSTKQVHGNYNAQADFLKDGVIEALAQPSGTIPETRGAAVYNLTIMKKVRFIPLDDEAMRKIMVKYPYFIKVVIPAGLFPNQDTSYTTLGVPVTVATHDKVSNEMVYKFVKTLYENKAEFLKAFPGGKEFVDPDKIKALTIPLHPGALQYYKEKGIETPKQK